MFSFGKSQRDDIFEIDDIRQLVLAFPQNTSLNSPRSPSEALQNDDLVPLASGNGFIQLSALIEIFHKLLDKKYGRLPVSALTEHLDVSGPVLLRLIRENEDVILSKNGNDVLTHCEQRRLLETLQSTALDKFIRAEEFSQEHDISRDDISKLVGLSEQSPSSHPPIQFLFVPAEMPEGPETSDYPYIHTLPTLLNLREKLSERIKASLDEAKPASWTSLDFLGLSSHAYQNLAQRIVTDVDDPTCLQGYFESEENELRFVPRTYLLRKATRHVKEVAHGEIAYCDLKGLADKFPTLLRGVEAAKDFVEHQCHDKHGSPYKFHFVSHYAVGDAGLNNTAKKCLGILGNDRWVNTKPYLCAFPEAIQEAIQTLLLERTILLFRYLGGYHFDVKVYGSYIIQNALIGDLAFVAQRLATQAVDEVWKQNADVQTTQTALAAPRFLEKLHEESEIETALLQYLWTDTEHGVYIHARNAYNDRLGALQAETQAHFVSQWKSRVVLKTNLHSSGLDALEESPLKEGLRELLWTHVSQDLMQSAIKRAKTKNLIRTPQLQRNITKLEGALTAQEKEKASPLEALTMFNKKMDIERPNEEEMASVKQEYLQDILQSMEEDTDGPRLFLGVVINLFASKQIGVLYATGKFAPRILKLLKSNLETGQYRRLEVIKEAVKAGIVDDGMRDEMKAMAKNCQMQ